MVTTPTASAPPATPAAQNSGTVGKARLAESFDTFISLLTTQMKNQDPLSPLDSNQFTQQLVQMTGVEQQLFTNDLLQKLVSNTGSGISTAVSLIGKQVRATSPDAALTGGKADWHYKLNQGAADVKIEVVDSHGKVVKTVAPTDNVAGEHAFTWNGKDASGAQLPNGGVYTLRVTAKDDAGAKLPTTTYVDGLVTGVEQVDGKTLITLNGAKIPWETVTSINQPPTASANNNTPGGQTTPPPAA